MKSAWKTAEAKACVAHYRKQGVNEDLALRVYTTRLLGRNPALVLHGGGNTSVKTMTKDRLGKSVEVLSVKGSGWDMGDIEPAGLPAVRLAPLLELRFAECSGGLLGAGRASRGGTERLEDQQRECHRDRGDGTGSW